MIDVLDVNGVTVIGGYLYELMEVDIMKNFIIIGTSALVSVLIEQRFLALPDLALGLGYGIG